MSEPVFEVDETGEEQGTAAGMRLPFMSGSARSRLAPWRAEASRPTSCGGSTRRNPSRNPDWSDMISPTADGK